MKKKRLLQSVKRKREKDLLFINDLERMTNNDYIVAKLSNKIDIMYFGILKSLGVN